MGFFSEETEKKLKRRGALPANTPEITYIPTGIYALDYAIGGGYPRQRVTEISGKNGTSKTTLSLIAAAQQIKLGNYVALIETENTLDIKWLNTMGIPTDEIYMGEKDKDIGNCHLHIWHPEYLESALETLLMLYREDKYTLIIIDSFGGSPVRASMEGTMEDVVMMKRARIGSAFKEVMMATLPKGHAAIILNNHVYLNIQQQFYDKLKPEGGSVVSSGGESIPFLSGLRIYMKNPKKIEDEKNKGVILGKVHSGMIHKNKTGRPVPIDFEFRLMIEPAVFIDTPSDIRDTALELGILEQSGRFWKYQNEVIAGSGDEMISKIMNIEHLAGELEGKIKEAIAGISHES